MAKSTLQHARELCSKYDIRPRMTSGQTYLINTMIADRIVEAGEPYRNLAVLEIGPGLGILSIRLAMKAKRIIAVELDRHVIPALQIELGESNNVNIIRDDIMKWWKKTGRLELRDTPYCVVSNLPYAITSAVLREFLTTDPKPAKMILMVQKEVADRITAKPGQMSKLALSVQAYATVEELFDVSRDQFWPKPGVDSAIIRLKDIKQSFENEKTFFQLIRAAFAGKRKQLKNSLSSTFNLSSQEVEQRLHQANIPPTNRPQDLSLDNWKGLAGAWDVKE